MKKYLTLLALCVVVFSGCLKKKDKSVQKTDKKKSTSVKKTKSSKKSKSVKSTANDESPLLYNYEDNSLFNDESSIALLDEDMIQDKGTSTFDENELSASAQDVEDEIDQLISLWNEDLPEEDIKYEFKPLNFEINKAELSKDQKSLLKEDIDMALAAVDQGKEIIVQGYTCQTGPSKFNSKLSAQRAEAVAKELIKAGIPAESIQSTGLGAEDLLVWTTKEDRESLINELKENRRVELSAV